MAIRCEDRCSWCDDRCNQARNFRYGGHVDRCLCPKHTSMALAQTAKEYICSTTDTVKIRREDDNHDSRTQHSAHTWTDWSTRYWTPNHEGTSNQGWYASGWSSTHWSQAHAREREQEPTDYTRRAPDAPERGPQDRGDNSGQAATTDEGLGTRPDGDTRTGTDAQQNDNAQTSAAGQPTPPPTATAAEKNDTAGQFTTQANTDVPETHAQDSVQGTGWEEGWWKSKPYYSAVEATDKADKDTNPWAKARQTTDQPPDDRQDPQPQEIRQATQLAADGVPQGQPTEDAVQADRSNDGAGKNADTIGTENIQEASPHLARDGDRREVDGRPQEAVETEARTAEPDNKSNQKGLLAVAIPHHRTLPARRKPADRRNRSRSTSTAVVPRTPRRHHTSDQRRTVPGPHTHRRIGEASNPGPPTQAMGQTQRGTARGHEQARCARCGNRWQTNASRAPKTDHTAYMACGARGYQPYDTAQSVRSTLLHFVCATCAWSSCPGCAGITQTNPPDDTTGPNETSTPMSDQAKRRRSRTPETLSRNNTPGPSSKVRRRGQTDRTRDDEESGSSDSSTSELPLPDSVRRILDFEQWAGSTSTSSSEEDTDEPPTSIPLRPYSEPDIPTPRAPTSRTSPYRRAARPAT